MITRRAARSLAASLSIVLTVVLVVLSCSGSGIQVMRDQQVLKDQITLAKNQRGQECAPVFLAKAEAHMAFASVEMREGDALRADEHIRLGTDAINEAMRLINDCVEPTPEPTPIPPPKDTDGDGIVDKLDACPDEPEDFDGVEDEDGCPDGPKDRDGDGITDDMDLCPDVPEDKDGVEDEDGCPDETLDRDGDGIPDSVDQCPDEAEDKDGFQDPDGCPDVDNDGDGIFDVVDKCPDEGEDFDGFEDEDGCPEPDNDNDGFVDTVDNCPMEPETPNGYEDEDGCPDTKPELPKRVQITSEQIKISEQVKFKLNSAEILPESHGILDDVVKVLKAYPRIKIRIEGHTDDQGSEVYNLGLSKRRAASVRQYFIDAGVSEDRMTSVGLGESTPLVPGTSKEARAANRRVEFHITDQ